MLCSFFVVAKQQYANADFGNTFGQRSVTAQKRLSMLSSSFDLCAAACNKSSLFMQSIVFPEVMRYNSLKDDIETESLHTLYAQFGEEYANFSIGLFQMKPSFAQQVEEKSKLLLSDDLNRELQLAIKMNDPIAEREERIKRLEDNQWQMIYLTAFICICDTLYSDKIFSNEADRLQWYATVYNAGFDKQDNYISEKIKQENFYLNQDMPGKKFKYAAIAAWFYNRANKQ